MLVNWIQVTGLNLERHNNGRHLLLLLLACRLEHLIQRADKAQAARRVAAADAAGRLWRPARPSNRCRRLLARHMSRLAGHLLRNVVLGGLARLRPRRQEHGQKVCRLIEETVGTVGLVARSRMCYCCFPCCRAKLASSFNSVVAGLRTTNKVWPATGRLEVTWSLGTECLVIYRHASALAAAALVFGRQASARLLLLLLV